MKLIIAYVRPEKLRDVKTALANAEIYRVSLDNVRASGDEPVVTEHYRGSDVYVDTYPRVRFEIAVNDAFVDTTINAIRSAAETGEDGDGHILVLNIEHAVKIKTGETGGDAIA